MVKLTGLPWVYTAPIEWDNGYPYILVYFALDDEEREVIIGADVPLDIVPDVARWVGAEGDGFGNTFNERLFNCLLEIFDHQNSIAKDNDGW